MFAGDEVRGVVGDVGCWSERMNEGKDKLGSQKHELIAGEPWAAKWELLKGMVCSCRVVSSRTEGHIGSPINIGLLVLKSITLYVFYEVEISHTIL